MEHPRIVYNLDEVLTSYIKRVIGDTWQNVMIGTEVCVGLGFASRHFEMDRGIVTMIVRATEALKSRVKQFDKQ